MNTSLDGLDADVLAEFFDEFHEAYQECEATLIALEDAPERQDLLHSLFRVVHTIKGNLGFIRYEPLIPLLQQLEDLLGAIRSGKKQYDSLLCDVILVVLDKTRQQLQATLDNKPTLLTLECIEQSCQYLTALVQAPKAAMPELVQQILYTLEPGIKLAQASIEPVNNDAHDQPLTKSPSLDSLLKHYKVDVDEELACLLDFVPVLDKHGPHWQGRTARLLFLCHEMNRLADYKVDPLQLTIAVLMHDLALCFVPVSATGEEADRLWRSHMQLSASLLSFNPRWQPAVEMIEQHHEFLDGTGYPKGLTQAEICDGARILSLADCFDVFLHERAASTGYKRPLVQAILFISQGDGSRFDPFWVTQLKQAVRQHHQLFH